MSSGPTSGELVEIVERMYARLEKLDETATFNRMRDFLAALTLGAVGVALVAVSSSSLSWSRSDLAAIAAALGLSFGAVMVSFVNEWVHATLASGERSVLGRIRTRLRAGDHQPSDVLQVSDAFGVRALKALERMQFLYQGVSRVSVLIGLIGLASAVFMILSNLPSAADS